MLVYILHRPTSNIQKPEIHTQKLFVRLLQKEGLAEENIVFKNSIKMILGKGCEVKNVMKFMKEI